ncbi:hypothetical protein RRG08_055771 [Elysia crispata]|uniref:Uncharacterized protein n=1 Tax=Elysia crispata TaxID=231223 RepID=A0AAE1ATC0_9GAST|nr:hypothetical protein RRG08_055771 [Elysia crispata]
MSTAITARMWNRSFSWWVSLVLIGEGGREGGRQAERGEGAGDISDGYSFTARDVGTGSFCWWVSWSNRKEGGEGGRQREEREGGGDISDGHSIYASRMWNRSFSGGCSGLIGEGGRGDRQREERGRRHQVMGTASRPGCGTGLSGGCPGLIGGRREGDRDMSGEWRRRGGGRQHGQDVEQVFLGGCPIHYREIIGREGGRKRRGGKGRHEEGTASRPDVEQVFLRCLGLIGR